MLKRPLSSEVEFESIAGGVSGLEEFGLDSMLFVYILWGYMCM